MTKNTGRWILLLSSSLFPHNQKTKETLHLSIFEINVQSRIETEKMEQSIVNEKNPKCSGPRFISFLLPHRGVTKEINEREISLYGFRFVRRNVFSVAPSSIPPPRSEELKAELENSEATRGPWNFKTSKTMIRSVSILSRGRNLDGSSARIIPTWDKTGATSVCRKLGVENRPAFRRYDKTNREKSEF